MFLWEILCIPPVEESLLQIYFDMGRTINSFTICISASGEIFLYEFRFEQRKITLAYIFFKN